MNIWTYISLQNSGRGCEIINHSRLKKNLKRTQSTLIIYNKNYSKTLWIDQIDLYVYLSTNDEKQIDSQKGL